jgi:hypothetical protein
MLLKLATVPEVDGVSEKMIFQDHGPLGQRRHVEM